MTKTTKTTAHFVLAKDEYVEGEETIDPQELTENILDSLKEATEWARGERKLRTSEFVNGQWVDRCETAPELAARRAKRKQKKHKAEEAA